MTKSIRTYKDLLEEKERLELLLKEQKAIVKQDFRAIKAEFEPVKVAASMISKFFSRDSSNYLLNAGVGAVIDLVLKKSLFAKAGWFFRRVVPFLLKNYSSHYISENKEGLLKKLFAWVGKMNANGHEKAASSEPKGGSES